MGAKVIGFVRCTLINNYLAPSNHHLSAKLMDQGLQTMVFKFRHGKNPLLRYRFLEEIDEEEKEQDFEEISHIAFLLNNQPGIRMASRFQIQGVAIPFFKLGTA